MVNSRSCFAKDSTDLFISAYRTCSTIIFPHSALPLAHITFTANQRKRGMTLVDRLTLRVCKLASQSGCAEWIIVNKRQHL